MARGDRWAERDPKRAAVRVLGRFWGLEEARKARAVLRGHRDEPEEEDHDLSQDQ